MHTSTGRAIYSLQPHLQRPLLRITLEVLFILVVNKQLLVEDAVPSVETSVSPRLLEEVTLVIGFGQVCAVEEGRGMMIAHGSRADPAAYARFVLTTLYRI